DPPGAGAGRQAAVDTRSPPPVAQVQPAFFGKCAVGLRDRIKGDAKLQGQTPNRRKNIPRLELAIHQMRAKGVHDLPVVRHWRIHIDAYGWLPFCHLRSEEHTSELQSLTNL